MPCPAGDEVAALALVLSSVSKSKPADPDLARVTTGLDGGRPEAAAASAAAAEPAAVSAAANGSDVNDVADAAAAVAASTADGLVDAGPTYVRKIPLRVSIQVQF